MESKRQHKLSRQFQKDINEVFQKDPGYFFGNRLVTITKVDVSPDLSLARFYFSVLPVSDGDQVIDTLNHKKGEIRKKLGLLIGKRVRKIPELAFFLDDTEEKASHLDRLIDNLDIPPAPDEPDEA